MHFRTLVSTVALALTANAIFLPSPLAEKPDLSRLDLDPSVPLDEIPRYLLRKLDLECRNCRFNIPRDQAQHTGFMRLVAVEHVKSSLEMRVTMESNEVKINGITIYPSTLPNIAHPMLAQQFPSNPVAILTHSTKPHSASLDYSMKVISETPFKGAASIAIVFQILGVDGAVADVDAIAIGILKKPDGSVIIHNVNTIRNTLSPAASLCTNMLCRVKAVVLAELLAIRAAAAAKFSAFKHSCARKLGFGFKPHHGPRVKGGVEKFASKFHAHKAIKDIDNHNDDNDSHTHHDYHDPHHTTFQKAVHVMQFISMHVLRPVFIGVVIGAAACGVGMLVGHLICFMWRRLRRSRTARYDLVVQSDATEDDGKFGPDSLPKYEEVEGHVDTEEKKEQA